MTRTEMIDNLIDSYTVRELKALATRLGIDVDEYSERHSGLVYSRESHSYMVYLADAISNIMFDPAGSYHEFNKLAEMEQ